MNDFSEPRNPSRRLPTFLGMLINNQNIIPAPQGAGGGGSSFPGIYPANEG